QGQWQCRVALSEWTRFPAWGQPPPAVQLSKTTVIPSSGVGRFAKRIVLRSRGTCCSFGFSRAISASRLKWRFQPPEFAIPLTPLRPVVSKRGTSEDRLNAVLERNFHSRSRDISSLHLGSSRR